MKWIIIFLVAALLLLTIIYAQIGIYKVGDMYSYKGCVLTLDQKPIQNARISYHFDGISLKTQTDGNGCYSINTDNALPSSATIEKSGYEFYFNGDYLTSLEPNNFIGWESVNEMVIHGGDINLLITENPSKIELINDVIVEVKIDDQSEQVKLMLSVVGGNVLKGDSSYPEIAPSSKYIESVTFTSSKNIYGNVYFNLNNTQKRGWFKFSYMPNTYKGRLFEIKEWSINNSSGKWLMYPKSGSERER